MKRRLLNLLTVLSLLLCAVLAVVGARSYWVTDALWWELTPGGNGGRTERRWYVSAGRGGLGVGWQAVAHPPAPAAFNPTRGDPPGPRWERRPPAYPTMPAQYARVRLGLIEWGVLSQPVGALVWRNAGANASCWFLVALTVLPAVRLPAMLRRGRRHDPGRCRHCGYDLRATPGRCPECGATPV